MSKYQHPYGPGSQHSYFTDLVHYSLRDNDSKQSRERLMRHVEDLELLDEARMIRTVENTIHRTESDFDEQMEQRAVTTASSSDGVFVAPNYLVEEGDFFRGYQSALIPQCTQVPDSGYGVTLAIPTLTAVGTTAQQTTVTADPNTAQQTTVVGENTGVSDSSPAGAYVTAGIATFVGEVPLSIQAYERSGPKPYTLDRILMMALRDDLQATLGSYAFSQVVASAGITNGAGSYSNTNFYEDVAKAQSQILTAAGVKQPASHAFTSPTLGQWLLSQSDTNGRPLLTPHLNGAPSQVRMSDYQGAAVGYTGTDLLGSHFFLDGTTPNQTGSATLSQIILADCQELFWTMSTPAVRVIGEGLTDSGQGANTLTVLLQYYCYAALVVRRSGAVQALNAAYLIDTPTFT